MNCAVNILDSIFLQAACETFCVGDANSIQEAAGALSSTDFSWSPGKFRLTPVDGERPLEISEGVILSFMFNKTKENDSLFLST